MPGIKKQRNTVIKKTTVCEIDHLAPYDDAFDVQS